MALNYIASRHAAVVHVEMDKIASHHTGLEHQHYVVPL